MSDDNASVISSTVPVNSEQRRIIKEMERKIIKTTDPEKIKDLLTDYDDVFQVMPTSKLNRINKIDGYKFYKRGGQTYFSKKSESFKECQQEILQLKSDMNEIKETLTGILQHLKIIG
jgi:hypothetical protein